MTGNGIWDRIEAIRRILPECSISTDMITGFSTETEEDHKAITVSLMKEVGYDFAYMFKYSERPDTKAARKYKDDVPEEIKTRRLNEIIELQNQYVGRKQEEGSGQDFRGAC